MMNDLEQNRRKNYEDLGRELMRVEAENAQLKDALRLMADSHRPHGYCRNNQCPSCHLAIERARDALALCESEAGR